MVEVVLIAMAIVTITALSLCFERRETRKNDGAGNSKRYAASDDRCGRGYAKAGQIFGNERWSDFRIQGKGE